MGSWQHPIEGPDTPFFIKLRPPIVFTPPTVMQQNRRLGFGPLRRPGKAPIPPVPRNLPCHPRMGVLRNHPGTRGIIFPEYKHSFIIPQPEPGISLDETAFGRDDPKTGITSRNLGSGLMP